MITNFTISPDSYIRTPIVADITYGVLVRSQSLVTISKNFKSYLTKKHNSGRICWSIPTPFLGKHWCSPQEIKRPKLLFSRMNNKFKLFQNFLQIRSSNSCRKGSVFKNNDLLKPNTNQLNLMINTYLMDILVTPFDFLFRRIPKQPI